MTGDGCLMEGVALEAISLAGSLQLNNLVLVYDNNQVTCDGPLDWINTEDVNAKMRACGWHVLEVADGSYDVVAIVSALNLAKTVTDKPVFINIRTVIGLGTSVAGTFKAHHGAFDKDSVAASKLCAGQDPSVTHTVPDEALSYFRERKTHGESLEASWDDLVSRYSSTHPDLARSFARTRKGDNGDEWLSVLKDVDSSQFKGQATREVNGTLIEKVWKVHPALCGGGADLVNSNKLAYTESDVFHPSVSYAGRYIRYGIREHAMAAISNGLAAYNPGTFLPITATFFIFYIYVSRSTSVLIRRACLMHPFGRPLLVYAWAHSAIFPSSTLRRMTPLLKARTVQHTSLLKLIPLYRAMPNLTYIRPCDAEETIGAWILALAKSDGPSLLSLGRDPVGPVPATDRFKVARGAYVVKEEPNAKVTLASCGTNLHYAVAAAEKLTASGVATRVVSCPSFDHFDKQDQKYRDSVFPRDGSAIVSVEEYVATTWARYVTASIGMTGYGYSASNPSNYDRFGLDSKGIESKVRKYLEDLAGENARIAGWRQL
ncbi:hypothetical protein NM208_g12417 [Fusarium decemcellulare]|uniref:Uncharacterized protein n=1 Tax=Fusarium decemcellulare TaxID=57161 RepID=A0ACC1RRE3_9HYPO|nr:hypothetical protein NM208_g12417 [Fusarium decemcellulare]